MLLFSYEWSDRARKKLLNSNVWCDALATVIDDVVDDDKNGGGDNDKDAAADGVTDDVDGILFAIALAV